MIRFQEYLEKFPFELLYEKCLHTEDDDLKRALHSKNKSLEDFAVLISPRVTENTKNLENLAQLSHQITQQRFGKTIQLYAPLYVSNECVDTCTYCGFSRENDILRRTLKISEIEKESQFLADQGIKHLLLVSGEHPNAVSAHYFEDVIKKLHPKFSSLSLEVAPQKEEVYQHWVAQGAEGLVVYQETYQKDVYARVHLAGKKKDYNWRLEAPERASRSGMKKLGIGILLGLTDWRRDVLYLALHALYLQKYYYRSLVTISLPRLRPAAGSFKVPAPVTDREFVQIICALRILLPDTGITLSTREKPYFRDGLIRIGITQMSAGSKTEPGGYLNPKEAEKQFEIEDLRSIKDVANTIHQQGYEAVFKDWESILNRDPWIATPDQRSFGRVNSGSSNERIN